VAPATPHREGLRRERSVIARNGKNCVVVHNVHLIQSDRKLDGLHGLRGVAALAVVLYHVQHIPGLTPPSWLASMTTHFNLSVHLFFVLSAFSLYHSSRYAPAKYVEYLVKRFFRIAPLYFVMLAFVVWRNGFPGWRTLASNLTFTFNLIPGEEWGMVWGGWSVGVEMLFYVLLPGLLFLIRGWVAFSILFLVTATLSAVVWHMTTGAPGLREDFAYLSFVGNMPLFSAGLLAYSLFKSIDLRRRQAWWNVIFALVFSILLSIAVLDPLDLHWRARGLYFAFWGLPFGMLCVWQALYPSKLMRSGPMQWLADRSFSIYLLHPVVIVLSRPAYEYLRNRGIPDGGWLYLACLAMTLPILLVAAQITYRFVELPGIGAGRRIAARVYAARKDIPSSVVSL
jgi:peptidoglycan/LPS O-acetylase OafA/YrhL